MMKRRYLPLIVAGLMALGLTAPAAASEPSLEISIDRFGSFTEDGYGVVRGTVVCSAGAWGATVDVRLQQKQGRTHVDGYGTGVIECDGTEQRWLIGGIRSTDVDRFGDYLYRGGPATVTVSATGGEFESVSASIVIRGPAL